MEVTVLCGIKSWLRIPGTDGASEEALASTICSEEDAWTDTEFPPDASSL